MSKDRRTLARMIEAYGAVREAGLSNVKLGNCGRFARAPEKFEALLTAVGAGSHRAMRGRDSYPRSGTIE